jgi:hypothetical protein
MPEDVKKEDRPEEPADSEKAHRFEPSVYFAVRSSRLMLGMLLIYGGIGVVVFFYFEQDLPFSYILEKYGAIIVGSLMVIAGSYLFVDEMNKRKAFRSERFIDVDARSRPETDTASYVHLVEKIAALEESSKANIQTVVDQFRASSAQAVGRDTEGFVAYFDAIRRVLEQKAAIADEKASILLDKGTSYSRFGIMFFIFSIVAWQYIAYANGFQTQYIYGIASCSLLFVFIEFLSAWFLKQYRQFVDTSTYLIKVKSIFDKYMLVYLAGKEAVALGNDTKKTTTSLIEMLNGDIKWPDSYLTKNPDISFAKEALETMSLFAKNMKSEAKSVAAKAGKDSSGA